MRLKYRLSTTLLAILLALSAAPTLAAPLGLISFPLPEEGAVIYDENSNGKADRGRSIQLFHENLNKKT